MLALYELYKYLPCIQTRRKRVIFRAAVDNELGIESFEIFTLKHILLFYLKETKLIISNDGL